MKPRGVAARDDSPRVAGAATRPAGLSWVAQVGGSTYDPPSGELRFHDCSTELKEAILSVEQPAPLAEHVCDELLPAETRPNGEDSLELVDAEG